MYHCYCCGRRDNRQLVIQEQICPSCNPEFYMRNYSWTFSGLRLQ
jgi:hypothetical protein